MASWTQWQVSSCGCRKHSKGRLADCFLCQRCSSHSSPTLISRCSATKGWGIEAAQRSGQAFRNLWKFLLPSVPIMPQSSALGNVSDTDPASLWYSVPLAILQDQAHSNTVVSPPRRAGSETRPKRGKNSKVFVNWHKLWNIFSVRCLPNQTQQKHICMIVCKCVCMYVCMHLCIRLFIYLMVVCMVVCMHVCMYVRMYVCMYLCIHSFIHLLIYGCMYVCMCVCMYVCMNEWMIM